MLQWYSRDARDSARTSDMSRIKSSLELFYVDSGRYPDPTEAQPVTYTWWLAWYQWIFWNSTFINVSKLDRIPTDPLTDKEYAYSVINSKQEYELWWIIEWSEVVYKLKTANTQEVNAAQKTARAKLSWNYNGLALRVNKNGTAFVLAIPSIMTSIDLSVENNRKLETIIPAKEIVLPNYKNLPNNYINSGYKNNEETTNTDFKIINNNDLTKAVLYHWDIKNLTASILIAKLQEAYTWTTVKSLKTSTDILEVNTNDVNQTTRIDTTWVHFINNHLWWSAESRIYSTCWWIAHNTTKSFYSGTWVTYTVWTCDGLKKDFICIDGTWKDWQVTADTTTYKYDTCIVEWAQSCTYLSTNFSHSGTLTVYSTGQTLYPALCTSVQWSVWCNDGTVTWDNIYGFLACSDWAPKICDPVTWYNNGWAFTWSYNVPQLNHAETYSWTYDNPENNGIFRYTLNTTCDNGTLNSWETGPVIQSCNTDYYNPWNNTCTTVWVWYYSANLDTSRTACTNYPDTSSRDYTYTSSWNWTNSCNANYTGLCWIDLYEVSNGVCSGVWIWNYSANLDNTLTACTNKPANSTYSTSWSWTNSCWYTCDTWYLLDAWSCRLPTGCDEVLTYWVTSAYSSDVYDINTWIAWVTKLICNNWRTLISSQDVNPSVTWWWFFTSENEAKYYRENDPNHARYSILNQLESFRATNGTFTFKLEWPDLANKYNEWTQTTNPLSDIDVAWYNPIHIDWANNWFWWLELSSWTHWPASWGGLLDWSVNHSNWWYVVWQLADFGSWKMPVDWLLDPSPYINQSYDLWIKKTTPVYKSSCKEIKNTYTVSINTYYPMSEWWVYHIDPSNNWTWFDVACDMVNDWWWWTFIGKSTWASGSWTAILTNTSVWDWTDVNATSTVKLDTANINTILFAWERKLKVLDTSSGSTKWFFEYANNWQTLDFTTYKSYNISITEPYYWQVSPFFDSHKDFILFSWITQNLSLPNPCTYPWAWYDRIDYWKYINASSRYWSTCNDWSDGWWDPFIRRIWWYIRDWYHNQMYDYKMWIR